MYKLIFITAFILGILSSCGKKETEEPINMGYNFFPIERGVYNTYEVDSIVWNDFTNSIDTFSFNIKLIVDSQFIDNAGRTSYWWKKYVKTDTTNFTFANNYTITKTDNRTETVIENIRYINLIFPMYAGAKWNSNSLNSDDATDAICDDIDFQQNILNHMYDSCASIIYKEEIDLVNELVHKEVYARNVGMIYKKQIHKVELISGLRGYSVEYKLSDYGKE